MDWCSGGHLEYSECIYRRRESSIGQTRVGVGSLF